MGCKADPINVAQVKDALSFTLTMWDVKIFQYSQNYTNIEMFYLNYVGCKGSIWMFIFPSQIVLP